MTGHDDETATETELRVNRRDVVRSVSVLGLLATAGTVPGAAASDGDETPSSPVLGGGGDVVWYRTGDRDGRETFRDAIPTADGGVTTLGLAAVDGGAEALQYGWSAGGEKEWTELLGDARIDSVAGGTRTASEGYVLCGRTRTAGEAYDRFYVVETGPRGEERWTRRFHVGGCTDDHANDVIQTADGGYAAVGVAADRAALATLGAEGDVELTTTYGGGRILEAVSLVEADEGYVLAGTATHEDDTHEFFLIKTDRSGREQWRRTYSVGEDSRLTDCLSTTDGYLLAGTATAADAFTTDALFVRTDLQGNVVWRQTYGREGEEYTADGITATENGYAFVGTRSTDVIGPLIWLGEIGESGDRFWTDSFGTERPEIPHAITTTADGFVAISGYTDSATYDGETDGFVAKLDLLDSSS